MCAWPPTALLLLRVCLQLKYFQSIREKKDVRFVMYILVPAASSRALQPWTQCGDGGWLGRGAGVRGAFFFNLPCSILTKLIFFQIKYFFAQQITNTIQIKSRLRPHSSGFHEFEHLNYNFCRPSVCMKISFIQNPQHSPEIRKNVKER